MKVSLDTNLSSPPAEVPPASYAYWRSAAVVRWYEGPPLVRMIQKTRRNVAIANENVARSLGLEGFVSCLRVPRDLTDLWRVQ